MSTSSEFVSMNDRLLLPLAAVRLALDLEGRGVRLGVVDGDILTAGPRHLLSDEDRQQIRRWKLHLLAIAAAELVRA